MASPHNTTIAEAHQTPPPIPADTEEPKYGGFTRFEIELEFINALSSPLYLSHLATQKYLQEPAFIAYLNYLQYWSLPPYTKYLIYPGPSLKNLELLQREEFRRDVVGLETVGRLGEEGIRAGLQGPGGN